MQDFQGSQDVDLTWNIYEYLPLGVLVLESVCAFLCNGAVLLLFCIRKSLLKTASDLFTINLSLVDLIFSGIVIPVVVLTSLTAINDCKEDGNKPAKEIVVARNCIVLFGTVATALGTLLVSLDRGDVSLKPSKRFFTQSKAILAIFSTWCIAIVGLAIAILPSLLSLDQNDGVIIQNDEKMSYISSTSRNETRIQYVSSMGTISNNCCNPHPCNPYTLKGCTIQLFFEIPIFIAAILTIVIIYGKILWSVQRRSKKYMHSTSKSSQSKANYGRSISEGAQCTFCGLAACCDRSKYEGKPKKDKGTRSEIQVENEGNSHAPKLEERRGSIRRKSLTIIKNLTTPTHKDAKKQDSLEDALFVPLSNEPEQNGNSKGAKGTAKKNTTDFASVAMSVTVVLAIKRMAARKIKERKKKIRRLRKMTFFIVFTFLFCWTPYYASKLSIALSLHISSGALFDFTNTSNMNLQNDTAVAKQCTPGWWFSWMIAIAALSCILNPVLYMFSREKIRLEFVRMFFPSCSRRNNADSQRRNLCSCLVCWDTEDNFKDRSPNLKRSVINSRWSKQAKNSIKKPRMELTTLPNQSCSHDRQVKGSLHGTSIMPNPHPQTRAPLLRWDVVNCDSLGDSHDSLHGCTECDSQLPNTGLLLPTGIRPRSYSAKSVDILSCSTTIASLAADL